MPRSAPIACPTCGKAGCTKRHRQSTPADAMYGRAWVRASREYLDEHPDCAHCGRTVYRGPDTSHRRKGHVDHIVPHRGDKRLFWRESNWQTLCQSCHRRKTAADQS